VKPKPHAQMRYKHTIVRGTYAFPVSCSCSWGLRVADISVSNPQTEKILSTYAWRRCIDSRSWANVANCIMFLLAAMSSVIGIVLLLIWIMMRYVITILH